MHFVNIGLIQGYSFELEAGLSYVGDLSVCAGLGAAVCADTVESEGGAVAHFQHGVTSLQEFQEEEVRHLSCCGCVFLLLYSSNTRCHPVC